MTTQSGVGFTRPYVLALCACVALFPFSVSALDIGGDISGTISDPGEIRLTADVRLTADTVIEADSDGSGDQIINIQGFAINGGGFNLTLHSGDDVALDVSTNIATLTLQSSDGNAVTYSSSSSDAFSAATVKNDGADDGEVEFSRSDVDAGHTLIFDLSQLQDVDTGLLSGSYRLANDIDASSTAKGTWNGGAGFNPIGSGDDPFTGVLDGNDKLISDLFIGGASHLGLMAATEDGYIHDLGLTNIAIETRTDLSGMVGSFVGAVEGGNAQSLVLSNVFATGTIDATNVVSHLGGLVGYTILGSIRDSHSDVDIAVSGDGGDVGGLVGRVLYAGVQDSFALGDTLGGQAWRVGGLVGTADGAGVLDSYNTGRVQGLTSVGGAVGFMIRGSAVEQCYSSGIVTSPVAVASVETAIGGLVGLMWASTAPGDSISRVVRSYSTGNVEAAGDNHKNVGGLVGGVWQGRVVDSYAVGDVITGTNANGVGGLIGGASDVLCCGYFYEYLDLQRSYSTGLVVVGTASTNVGGFLGFYTNSNTDSIFTNNYWSTNSSAYEAQADGVGSGDYSGESVDGISTIAITNETTYAGWDFTDGTGVWESRQDHRPHLQWESFGFGAGTGRRVAGGFGGGGKGRSSALAVNAGASVEICIAVNGSIIDCVDADGNSFVFENVDLHEGDAVLIFIRGASDFANLVGVVQQADGDLEGLHLSLGEVMLGATNGVLGSSFSSGGPGNPISAAHIDDPAVRFDTDGDAVTFQSRLVVPPNVNFVAHSTLSLSNGLSVAGTFDGGSNLTVAGTLDLDATGTTVFELRGYRAGADYDQLRVLGHANLLGKARVRRGGGFMPTNGAPFDLVIAASYTDALSELRLPLLRSTQTWSRESNATSMTVRAASIIDDDLDALDDTWEIQTFGSTNVTSGATDSDGDGVSDRDEYIAWTGAMDAADSLRILAVQTVDGGVRVRFNTVEGIDYRVGSSELPAASVWPAEALVSGTGAEVWSPIIAAPSGDATFVRISLDR